MTKQELASKIWAAANEMRGSMDAIEYKDYVLGFIFYKYLSDSEVAWWRKEGATEEDIEAIDESDESVKGDAKKFLGYFIAYKDLYSSWVRMGSALRVSTVTEAIHAFERNCGDAYKGIFTNLTTAISKYGANEDDRAKFLRNLVGVVNEIPTTGNTGFDVLGFVYEYLISMFAQSSGKKAGEFYTPHEVSLAMAKIVAGRLRDRVKEQEDIKVLDPTSGSGSLLLSAGKELGEVSGEPEKVRYYAQEKNSTTAILTRMNLLMRGISPNYLTVRNGDTLDIDWPFFPPERENEYQLLPVDAVVSNPPYSVKWDSAGANSDPRFSSYGVAPAGKADYAFLLHGLYHLKPEGIMAIVLPHGVLFRGGSEGEIRKHLIESGNIEAVIGLPANIFYGTTIATIVMILRKTGSDGSVLFVDASHGFQKDTKKNRLRASDIKRIVDTVLERKPGDGVYSRLVSKEEIRQNDYNLNIPRYVDGSEKPEEYDLRSVVKGGIPPKEIESLATYWDAFPGLKEAVFEKDVDGVSHFKDDVDEDAIRSFGSVASYLEGYKERFSRVTALLEENLVQRWNSFGGTEDVEGLENGVTDVLSGYPLVDRYDVYGAIHEGVEKALSDMEVLRAEGLDAIRTVTIGEGKKGSRQGRLVSLELLEECFFQEAKKEELRLLEEISSAESLLSEATEALGEEDRTDDLWDSENDEPNLKGIEAEAKTYLQKIGRKKETFEVAAARYEEGSYERTILDIAVASLAKKAADKELKDFRKGLEEKVVEKAASLTDEECLAVLRKRWIAPISDSLMKVADDAVDGFIAKLRSLKKKYEDTLVTLVQEISSVEKELATMLDELTGGEEDMEAIRALKALLEE